MSQMITTTKNRCHYGYSQKITSSKSNLKELLVKEELDLLEKYHESMINALTALATQVKNREVITSDLKPSTNEKLMELKVQGLVYKPLDIEKIVYLVNN